MGKWPRKQKKAEENAKTTKKWSIKVKEVINDAPRNLTLKLPFITSALTSN